MGIVKKIGGAGRRVVVVRLVHRGEEQELLCRPLTAKEQDEIRRLHPPPQPPRLEDKEGRKYNDTSDPEYLEKALANLRETAVAMVCRMLGAEVFGTADPAAQADILTGEYDHDEVRSIVEQARAAVETRDLDAEAEAVIRPTA